MVSSISSKPGASIRVGQYSLLERIGQGGNAVIYRGQTPENAHVALKLLSPHVDTTDTTARQRFAREIALLASIRHPNIVSVLDHGFDDEFGPFLVTPLITGANLRDALADTCLCPEAIILLACALSDAISALHQHGVMHRDLKPENIMASPGGRLLIVDFGLALAAGQTRYTEQGSIAGSVPYMSPERIHGASPHFASDVWSVGVMAYEWLAGSRPFERANPTEEAAAIMVGNFPRLTSADRRVDDQTAAVIEACLHPDPNQRPHAAALSEYLRNLIDWIPLHDIDEEIGHILAAPAQYQDRIASFRVAGVRRLAAQQIAAGNRFAALKLIDRGLAYLPNDPELTALCQQAEAIPGQHQTEVRTGLAPAVQPGSKVRAGVWASLGALAAIVIVAVTAFLVQSDSSADPPVSPTSTSDEQSELTVDSPEYELANQLLNLAEQSMAKEDGAAAPASTVGDKPSQQELGVDITRRMLGILGRAMDADEKKKRDSETTTDTSAP